MEMDAIITEKTFDEMNLPNTIYKYRNWNDINHKNIITNQEVYFAQPTSFEDPYDCKNLVRYDLLSDDDIYEHYLFYSKERHPNWTRQQHRAFAREWCEKSLMKEHDYVKKRMDEDFNEFDEHFGVLSLTANPHNSVMWEKYSDNHKGFVVGFNPYKMFQYLGGGGAVRYYDELPIVYPRPKHSFEKQHYLQIFSKLSKWNFEEEYRTHWFSSNSLTVKDRTKKLPPEAFTKIIIGKSMPKEILEDLLNSIPQDLYHVEIGDEPLLL
ncbi:hypothetical protein EZS27_027744 [termite gut metagenome]|uniref:DUF2971 domain-containing protein n=1 Tax=termite gut metagenome TaxID=433724 RepID=A0A5J4QME5_9ZZZZ